MIKIKAFAAVQYGVREPFIHPMFIRRTMRDVRTEFGEYFGGWDKAKRNGWRVRTVIVTLGRETSK